MPRRRIFLNGAGKSSMTTRWQKQYSKVVRPFSKEFTDAATATVFLYDSNE
jgi:hypothetical protein